jgi:hypothetical protein
MEFFFASKKLIHHDRNEPFVDDALYSLIRQARGNDLQARLPTRLT